MSTENVSDSEMGNVIILKMFGLTKPEICRELKMTHIRYTKVLRAVIAAQPLVYKVYKYREFFMSLCLSNVEHLGNRRYMGVKI